MSNFTAVFDACVLYPAHLSGLLMSIALTDLFRARWSDRILTEWIESLLRARPDLDRGRLERKRELMNLHVRDALVTGYEDLISALSLPDEDDRHVLAAAIRCGADVIVTFNLKDFPEAVLNQYGLEAQHPDVFLSYQFHLAPDAVCRAVKAERNRLKNPPYSVDEYLNSLEGLGLPETVAGLRKFADLL